MTKQKLELLFKIDNVKDRAIGSIHATERRLAVVFTRIEGKVEVAFDRISQIAEGL